MTTATKQVGCVKAATQILGDKWTPQLLRFFANKEVVHFCELQDDVGGINPRTLSARLSYLEEEGIIIKLTSDTNGRSQYKITSKGHDLIPILQSMQLWGEKHSLCDV